MLKHTRPDYHLDSLVFKEYPQDKSLRILACMEQYLKRTKYLRQGQKMMISTIKPHKATSQNTITRLVKLILSKAGIDRSFTAHSTRAETSSMAN